MEIEKEKELYFRIQIPNMTLSQVTNKLPPHLDRSILTYAGGVSMSINNEYDKDYVKKKFLEAKVLPVLTVRKEIKVTSRPSSIMFLADAFDTHNSFLVVKQHTPLLRQVLSVRACWEHKTLYNEAIWHRTNNDYSIYSFEQGLLASYNKIEFVSAIDTFIMIEVCEGNWSDSIPEIYN